MDCIETLSKYKSIIEKNSKNPFEFADKLRWITDRGNAWINDKIRVGVVGVTSSGKSTLINSILGVDILSSAVVPSTNQIIACSYGEECAIIVTFNNGKKKEYKDVDFNTQNIKKYSDETCNANNSLGVLLIEVKTPFFSLGNDVVLIDSPGLDAHGLEAHERLTLETVIPTIDVCIYVSTMKTNSDEKSRDIINTVARYDCSMVFVQNMLDSVKPAPDGRKSKEQVAHEHYIRVKRIIDNSDIKDKDKIKIIQVSAYNALKWRKAVNRKQKPEIQFNQYVESKYEYFERETRKSIDEYKQSIDYRRYESIYNSVEDTTKEIEPFIDRDFVKEKEKRRYVYLDQKKSIDDFKKICFDKMNKIDIDINKKTSELIDESMSKMNENNIDKYINNVNQTVNKLGIEIQNFVSYSNSFIKKICLITNIPQRDIFVMPQLNDGKVITIKTFEEEQEVKEKQGGVKGFFDRIAGKFGNDSDRGYETKCKKVVRKDVESAKNDIKERLEESKNKYLRTIGDWFYSSILPCIDCIEKTLALQEEKYNERRENRERIEGYLKLYDELVSLNKEIKSRLIISNNSSAIINDEAEIIKQKEYSDEYIGNILRLSVMSKRKQNTEAMVEIVRKEKLDGYIPVLLGWDENSIKEFSWNAGIEDLQTILIPKETPPQERDGVDTCFFVLVNAIQIGAAKKKISNLRLADIAEPNDYVFWIVQDFDELRNADSIEDGLFNMLDLKEFSGITCRSIIWLVSDNPLYNISFIEHQLDFKESLVEQQQYIEFIQNNYSCYCDEEVINTIARDILRVGVE